VTRIGLPKLWSPEAEGSVGGPVRFTARLSTALPWRVEVKDAGGAVVAARSGTGTAVDWTWDATAVPIASYTYTISAGPNVRPSTLPVPGPPPLAITRLKASPRAVTPNGDWSGERTSVRFGLNRRALLSVRVVSVSTGNPVRTLLASATRSAGRRSVSWDGRSIGGTPVPDGRYRIEVSAESGVEQVTRSIRVVVDRTLGGVVASPRVFSPNGDGAADRLEIDYELTRGATVRVQIRRGGELLRTVFNRSQAAGAHTAAWNGRAHGARVADGDATAVVFATTSLGTRKLSRSLEIDTKAPVVHVLSLRTVKGVMRLRLHLSEHAKLLRVWHGRETWSDGGSFVVERPAGDVWIRRPLQATKVVRILPTDDGFNRGAAVIHRARRG
jgi:flagellar hook assembly protein FlgD